MNRTKDNSSNPLPSSTEAIVVWHYEHSILLNRYPNPLAFSLRLILYVNHNISPHPSRPSKPPIFPFPLFFTFMTSSFFNFYCMHKCICIYTYVPKYDPLQLPALKGEVQRWATQMWGLSHSNPDLVHIHLCNCYDYDTTRHMILVFSLLKEMATLIQHDFSFGVQVTSSFYLKRSCHIFSD